MDWLIVVEWIVVLSLVITTVIPMMLMIGLMLWRAFFTELKEPSFFKNKKGVN